MLGPLMFFTSVSIVSIVSILRNMWSFDVIRDGPLRSLRNMAEPTEPTGHDQLETTTLSEPFNVEVSRFRLHRTSVVDRPILQKHKPMTGGPRLREVHRARIEQFHDVSWNMNQSNQ